MIYGILNKRLKSHLWKFAVFDIGIYQYLIFHDIPVTHLLYLKITLNMLLLLTYRNDIHRKTQVVMLVVPYILETPDVEVEQELLTLYNR